MVIASAMAAQHARSAVTLGFLPYVAISGSDLWRGSLSALIIAYSVVLVKLKLYLTCSRP
ncbi:hypothetical protein R6Q59_030257 [Mikania micrantha]